MASFSGWRVCRLVQHRWAGRKASEAAGELEIPEDSGRRAVHARPQHDGAQGDRRSWGDGSVG